VAAVDVWFDADGVTAVAVADRQLAVMRFARAGATWSPKGLARLSAPDSDAIETATLVRDGRGQWWVAAVVQSKVYVWNSTDARKWSRPTLLARGLDTDDIGLITRIPGGIAVIWSNQHADAVFMRMRHDTASLDAWQPVEVIEQGGGTADDHLHAALSGDGTLWLASKNSVDTEGAPQLVLRIRSPEGHWRNLPYAPVTDDFRPSRPIVIATPDPKLMVLGHVMYGSRDSRLDHVVFGTVGPADAWILQDAMPVIAPEAHLATRVNDVTGPKAAFPDEAPWIVLASDGDGRVFEADLRTLLGNDGVPRSPLQRGARPDGLSEGGAALRNSQ
jgi:hypothetical protein